MEGFFWGRTEKMYSLLTIAIYSIGVFALTLLTTSLPLLVHMSKKTSKVINLIGIGLMMGTAFIVVIPEAVLHGCECPVPIGTSGSTATEEHHLEAKNIGLAMVFGFITMMVTDSLSHGSGDDHNHGDHHDNETCSDHGKEEVVINMSENGVKRLRTSISGLCLHSLFDGLAIGSSISSGSVEVIQTIFGAILLHKVSASLGVGIFIKQLHVPFNQGVSSWSRFTPSLPVHCNLLCCNSSVHGDFGVSHPRRLILHSHPLAGLRLRVQCGNLFACGADAHAS